MTTNRTPNRLIAEKSPYLLQHAYNPVDWYAWGDEAFDKAKREGKPIFLSIGYSTCHWCHVMAHESFEDEKIAQMLNANFIAIKVDREERPDIDAVYMKVCQMMTGQGGWPLTIFMTPDQIPFYAGTYFPKESKYGMPGLTDALTQLHEKYTQDSNHISKVTQSVTQALKQTMAAKSTESLTSDTIKEAVDQLQKSFDPKYGGFGTAPKFPAPQNLLFLMRHYKFTGDNISLKMVESTLQAMATGGIYDHIGFGFSRYSTDKAWLVPHFEKMLYDNALLLMAYTECYQITKKEVYQTIAEQIIQFISREMTSPDGAFYSAIDADSEGVEGKYYVWAYEEIFDLLGENLGEMFTSVYNITPYGNFEGNNIPNLIGTEKEAWISEYNISMEELDAKLEEARLLLLEAREQRVYPHVDDKQLTGWNALMIAALAKAGSVFNKQKYTTSAEKARMFIEKHLFQKNRLMARYRDGEVKHLAYLDDYAFLLWAYINLYEATFETAYLQRASNIADNMITLFWDSENGGFYFNGHDSESLISREKEVFDSALPSGNSVAAVALVRLSYLTGDLSYQEKVETMYYSFHDELKHYAVGGSHFLQSILLTAYPTKEVILLGDKNDPNRVKLINALQKAFLPDVSLLVGETADNLAEVAPFTADYRQLRGQTTVYVCEHFTCKQPTTDIEKALRMIIHLS